MKYYKNENNEVFSFSEDGSHDYLIGDKTKITEEEFLNFIKSIEETRTKIAKAKQYLVSTDWYYARKAENGDLVPEEVVAKRVEAREFIRTNEALEVK